MSEKKEKKYENVNGKLLYGYLDNYKMRAYAYNRYHFDRAGKPKPGCDRSEPLPTFIQYHDAAEIYENADPKLLAELSKAHKEVWRQYFLALEDEVYPILDKILGVEMDV